MTILRRVFNSVSRSHRFNPGLSLVGLGYIDLEQLKSCFHQNTDQFSTRRTRHYSYSQTGLTMEKVRVVDFRSDTVSKPTEGMRRAMYDAEVGDDVMGEDPTVNALEKLAANLFGKEASIFVTSGTMGNLIATMVHCDRRGCEMIVGDQSHMLLWEQSGAAQLAGVQMTTVTNLPDGTWDLDEMVDKLRDDSDVHSSQTGLICVENTHNRCGGKALPLSWLDKLAGIARDRKIPLHLDGARVFNAALCSGVSVAELARDFASVSVCLSKGLGAPIGSVLIGDKHFVNKARRMRKVLGGGWRQAGVVAAAGLYALEHMVDRLVEDHQRARALAQAIIVTGSQLISPDEVQSNMVFLNFNTPHLTATDFCQRLLKVTEEEKKHVGTDAVCVVKLSPKSCTQVRIVLHCNITDQDMKAAINKLQYVLKEVEQKENQISS